MTAPTCPTCQGSGEVPVNPEAAWSGHVQALTFRACECGDEADVPSRSDLADEWGDQ